MSEDHQPTDEMAKVPAIDLENATREELVSHIKLLKSLMESMQGRLKLYHDSHVTLLTKGFRRKAKVEYNRMTLDDQGVFELALTSLEKFPLFKEFPHDLKKKLASCLMQIKRTKDSFVVKKGDIGAEMFFIYKGSVSIIKDDDSVIATLNQDSFFGELGLLFQEKRTASVKVVSQECILLLLTRKSMERVLEQYPSEFVKLKAVAKDRNAWFQKLRYISDNKGDNFGGEFVADIILFEEADEEFLHLISLKVVPETFQDGDLIVKKNEDANEMFLILSGSVEVVSDDMKIVFASMKQGSFFGEVGILLKTKRTANVRAKGVTTLLKLRRDDLNEVTAKCPKIEEELKKAAEERFSLFQKRSATNNKQSEIEFEMNIQNLVKFANCERAILDSIASKMFMKRFKPGEFIITCGEKANDMYFLTNGQASIISEFNELIAHSGPGSFFGEVGILHNLPRIASVKARDECITYVLNRDDLIRCLEEYPDLLQELKSEASVRLQNYLMRNILA